MDGWMEQEPGGERGEVPEGGSTFRSKPNPVLFVIDFCVDGRKSSACAWHFVREGHGLGGETRVVAAATPAHHLK